MTANIETFFVQQYANTVSLLLQQEGSRFRSAVDMNAGYVGKQVQPVVQLGAVAAQKRTGRFQPMGRVDAPTDARWVFPVDYDLPQLFDKFDALRVLVDPRSKEVQNAVNAMGRAIDDEIIAAFFGDAKTGENAGTTTSFPSGQQVSVDEGGTAAGLNVAKLKAARKLLLAAEVDLEREPVYIAISAQQDTDLLGEIQVISTDFNSRPVLADGRIVSFLGFKFIYSERLPTDSNSYRRVPVWVPSGMHLGVWGDIATDISQRRDLQGLPWQAYCTGTFGATRLEEKRIVEIKCSEA